MSLGRMLWSLCSSCKPKVFQQSWPLFGNFCRPYSLYNPPYLDIKPEFPYHETLNIRLRGYDFVVLESFAKYVHNLAKVFGLESTVYAVPARTSKIHSFKPLSLQIEQEYDVAVYERTVQHGGFASLGQVLWNEIGASVYRLYHPKFLDTLPEIDDLTSIAAPVFFEVMQLNMPSGVEMTVKQVDADEEIFRYVPDLTLRELHSQIEELDKVKDDRKRK